MSAGEGYGPTGDWPNRKARRMAESRKRRSRKKGGPYSPGTCRDCGCTDERACPEGCGWADEGHTLCTACAEKKKAVPVLGEEEMGT